jgi:hypothetical protein
MPTRCILYAINSFFAGVLGIADGIVSSTLQLINLAFGFKFLVAGDMSSDLFGLARGLICYSLNVFLVHRTPLRF